MPVQCKMEKEASLIQQIMIFKYLEMDMNNNRDFYGEVQRQTVKAILGAGCLNVTVFQNIYTSMNKKSRVTVYKSMIRLVLTYGIETRSDTK